MKKVIAVLLLFATAALTSFSSGSEGGKTVKTDYGGIELPLDIDAFTFVADEAPVPTGICLKEAYTFERMYEPSLTVFSFIFSPYTNGAEPRPDYNHPTIDLNQGTPHSGYNSIEDARLKIVLPLRC